MRDRGYGQEIWTGDMDRGYGERIWRENMEKEEEISGFMKKKSREKRDFFM